MTSTIKIALAIILLVLLWGCERDDTDSPECTRGLRCLNNVMQRCVDSHWKFEHDCTADGRTCSITTAGEGEKQSWIAYCSY